MGRDTLRSGKTIEFNSSGDESLYSSRIPPPRRPPRYEFKTLTTSKTEPLRNLSDT